MSTSYCFYITIDCQPVATWARKEMPHSFPLDAHLPFPGLVSNYSQQWVDFWRMILQFGILFVVLYTESTAVQYLQSLYCSCQDCQILLDVWSTARVSIPSPSNLERRGEANGKERTEQAGFRNWRQAVPTQPREQTARELSKPAFVVP